MSSKSKALPKQPEVNIGTIGHVDHGKSTTVGHLFSLTGAVDERTTKAYEEEAKKHPFTLREMPRWRKPDGSVQDW